MNLGDFSVLLCEDCENRLKMFLLSPLSLENYIWGLFQEKI